MCNTFCQPYIFSKDALLCYMNFKWLNKDILNVKCLFKNVVLLLLFVPFLLSSSLSVLPSFAHAFPLPSCPVSLSPLIVHVAGGMEADRETITQKLLLCNSLSHFILIGSLGWSGGKRGVAAREGQIKDTLNTVHRVKERPSRVVAGTAFFHGSMLSIYI